MPFQKGQSGNPAGRPVGCRNKTSLMAEMLLGEDAEAVVRNVIDLARQGDRAAMRLCLDRIYPRAKARPIVFELPPIEKPADAIPAMNAILQGVCAGELTIEEGTQLTKLVEKMAQIAGRVAPELRVVPEERAAPEEELAEHSARAPGEAASLPDVPASPTALSADGLMSIDNSNGTPGTSQPDTLPHGEDRAEAARLEPCTPHWAWVSPPPGLELPAAASVAGSSA